MYKILCNYAKQFDNNNNIIATVDCKENFTVQTINAFGNNFTNIKELHKIILNSNKEIHHHPLTGPIYVNNAEKGDVLKVNIKKINIKEIGQILSKSSGVKPLQEIQSFSDRIPIVTKYIDKNKGIKYFHETRINYQPSIGIIGTEDEKEIIKAGHVGKTGGNLDIPFITENTSVYIPVTTKGAKLYFGDVHAAQAYGELSGVALETSAEIICNVNLLKRKMQGDHIILTGVEPLSRRKAIAIIGIAKNKGNLHEAVLDAYNGTVNVLKNLLSDFSTGEIKSLISIIGHSINGQAFAKTSESTNIILIMEDDLKGLIKDCDDDILEYIEKNLFMEKKL